MSHPWHSGERRLLKPWPAPQNPSALGASPNPSKPESHHLLPGDEERDLPSPAVGVCSAGGLGHPKPSVRTTESPSQVSRLRGCQKRNLCLENSCFLRRAAPPLPVLSHVLVPGHLHLLSHRPRTPHLGTSSASLQVALLSSPAPVTPAGPLIHRHPSKKPDHTTHAFKLSAAYGRQTAQHTTHGPRASFPSQWRENSSREQGLWRPWTPGASERLRESR